MSEKPNVPPYSPQTTESHYEVYKKAVDAKDRAIDIDQARTIKKQIVRQLLAGTTKLGSDYNKAMREPDDALKASKTYYTAHKDEVMQEAVHDATAEGVVLNLPENGHIETVSNVQQQPVEQVPKPKA